MRKSVPMLALLMIATSLSFGQIVKKDSLYCRTIAQEKEVITTYQQKDLLDTMYSDCKDEVNSLRLALNEQDSVIDKQVQIIAKCEIITSEKDVIISAKDSDLKAEKKKNRRLQVRNVLTTSIGGVSMIGNILLVVKLIQN